MLSYTFINSHSQVSDPWPKGPLVFFKKEDQTLCNISTLINFLLSSDDFYQLSLIITALLHIA